MIFFDQRAADASIKLQDHISNKGFAHDYVCIAGRNVSCLNTSDKVNAFRFFQKREGSPLQEHFLFSSSAPLLTMATLGFLIPQQPVPYKWNPFLQTEPDEKVLRPHLPCSRSEGLRPSMGDQGARGGRSTSFGSAHKHLSAYKYGSGASGRNKRRLPLCFLQDSAPQQWKNPFFLRIANTGGSAVSITSEVCTICILSSGYPDIYSVPF